MLTRNDTDQFLRMQTDLKLGLPILVSGKQNIHIIFATESITKDNFTFFMNLRSGKPIICVTARRARTLKARVYDENICRIEIPSESDLDWIKARRETDNGIFKGTALLKLLHHANKQIAVLLLKS